MLFSAHMENKISDYLNSSAKLKQQLARDPQFVTSVHKSANAIATTLQNNGTIFVCGNGGSACDAAHFVEELVARFKRERRGFKAMHFGDPGTLTCWGNDYDYKSAFERQAKVFCGPTDLLVGISTSGNSENVVRAVKAAKAQGSNTIGLCGKNGGQLKKVCDLSVLVAAEETERIQEAHITVIHIWCELLETEWSW